MVDDEKTKTQSSDDSGKIDIILLSRYIRGLMESFPRTAPAAKYAPLVAAEVMLIGSAAEKDPTLLKTPENYLIGLNSKAAVVLADDILPDKYNIPKAQALLARALDVQPSLDNHATLLSYAADEYYLTRDSSQLKDASRDKDGNVNLTDPSNFPKLRAAITEVRDAQKQIADDNASWSITPIWLRDQDKMRKHSDAALVVGSSKAALAELDDLEGKYRAVQKSQSPSEQELGVLPAQPVGKSKSNAIAK